MRILLANPRGFCAGVEMAINSLELALRRFGAPLYVYHQIVHNTYLVERFRARGAHFVNCLSEVPLNGTVLYSAHGVSPEVRREAKERRLTVIDTTCPLVTKVHNEAKRFASKGYRIVLIGEPEHDEVVGVTGEAQDAIQVVNSVDDVEGLEQNDLRPIAYLTQTTLSNIAIQPIKNTLQQRYPDIISPRKDDICFATQNRQNAVRSLASKAQLALIIGSQHSSNSRNLARVAREEGVRAKMIDDPGELQPEWFGNVNTLLLTAGASVPEELVQTVVSWLKREFDAQVEEKMITNEHICFKLPSPLRGLKKVAN